MICPNCGNENPSRAYCAECGARLDPGDTVMEHPRRESLLKREIVIIFAGLAALIGAAFGAWYILYASRSPGVVVVKFIEADRAGRLAEEQQYVSNHWDSRMVLSAMQTFRGQTGSSLFQKYSIAGVSEFGETATVNVQITVNPPPLLPGAPPPVAPAVPTTMFVPFTLIREGRDWKIDASQTLAGVSGVLMAMGIQQAAPTFQNLLPPGVMPGFGAIPPIAAPPLSRATPPSSGGSSPIL
jgi:hypothetical protein